MNGRNPYTQDTNVSPPERRYTVTFLPANKIVEVNPEDLPYDKCGLPGSILDIAFKHGVNLNHACGGMCACSTCHVIVKQGLGTCNKPTDAEEDRLDDAYHVTPQSRLACQCVPNGTQDIVVEIPAWNRNLSREGLPPT